MAKVTVRNETGKLVMDFTYRNVRCREQTALPDTLQNRKRVEAVLEKIKKALKNGTFQYRDYFPESALASRFDQATTVDAGKAMQSPVNSPSRFFKTSPPSGSKSTKSNGVAATSDPCVQHWTVAWSRTSGKRWSAASPNPTSLPTAPHSPK